MAGAIAYISRDTDGVQWKKILEAALGPLDFRTLKGGLGNTDDIEIALAWKPDRGLLATFRNLRMIVSLGMGVDHLLADDKLPAGVPITRIMDDGLVGQMSEYAIYWALRHHRDIDRYAASQRHLDRSDYAPNGFAWPLACVPVPQTILEEKFMRTFAAEPEAALNE